MAFVRNVVIFQFLVLVAFIQVNRGSHASPYLDIYPKLAETTWKNESIPLYFGLMLSLSGSDQSSGVLAGVQTALDEINGRDDLLPGYALHYTLTDSKCNKTAALDQLFLQLLDSPHPKVALIESGCSSVTEATAEISQYFNIIHISTLNAIVLSSEFGDEEHVRFPYYFQLLPSEVNLARAFYSIIKEYTWNRVALIIQNEHRFKTITYKLMELLSNSTVTHTEVYFDNNYKKLLGQESAFDSQFRVYVLAMDSKSARYFLCQAYGLGLKYPKYLFLTYGTYESQWWTKMDDNIHCSSEDLAEVLQYSLAAMHHPSDDQQYNLHYDATWILAYALDSVIKYGDPPWDASETKVSGSGSEYSCLVDYKPRGFAPILMRRHLFSTNLTGLSGPITFDQNGIRTVSELGVLQYRKTHINGTLISDNKITKTSPNNGLKLIDIAVVKENSETGETLSFIMGDKYTIWPGYIPYDGSPREELVTILVPITVIFSFLNICGIACAIVCLLFNIIFRNRKIIRLNSPNLNYFIISGAMIMFVSGSFFVLPTFNPVIKSTTCIVRAWLVALGHSFGFGTVIAKLWRIYIIFKHPRKAQRKAGIKDWHLMLIVFGLILVDVTILTIYTALEGFSARFNAGKEPNSEKSRAVVGEQDIDTVYFVTTCSAKSWIRQGSISIIHFYKGILHICALYFAFQTRKIKIKALNDAKYIIMFTYTATIVLAVAAIAVIILQPYHNAYAAVYSLGIWLASFAILGFLFIPKMVLLYKDPDGVDIFPTQTGPQFTVDVTQGGQQEFVDIDAFKHKIKQLENELMKYNRKMPAENEVSSQGSQVQE